MSPNLILACHVVLETLSITNFASDMSGRGIGAVESSTCRPQGSRPEKRPSGGRGQRRSQSRGRWAKRQRVGGGLDNASERELVGLCRKDDFEGARVRFEEMRASGHKPQQAVFVSMLTMCCNAFEAGGRQRGREQRGRSEKPVTSVSGAGEEESEAKEKEEVAETAVDSGRRRALAEAAFAYMNECRVEPNEQVYNMLIRTSCLDGALDEGLERLALMKAAGWRVKLRSLSPLIQLACRLGRVDVAKDLRDAASGLELAISEADHVALFEATRDEDQLFEMALDIHAPSRATWDSLTTVLEESGFVATRDTTVSASGVCNACGRVLRSIDLTADERRALLDQIHGLVMNLVTRTEDGKPALAGVDAEPASASRKAKQWETFRRWIDPKHFDAVIDGANVGFHSNGMSDVVDFRHIDLVLRHCLNIGKRALIVLHARHLADERVNAAGHEARDIVKSWRRGGHLYSCSVGNNDDWYWLFAAVKGGENAILVSNDEMRDHHFGMVSRRPFLVWKERHLTKFSLGPWRPGGARTVALSLPLPFSIRMQRIDRAWHVPAHESLRGDGASSAGDGDAPSSKHQHQEQQVTTVVLPKLPVDDIKWLCLACP